MKITIKYFHLLVIPFLLMACETATTTNQAMQNQDESFVDYFSLSFYGFALSLLVNVFLILLLIKTVKNKEKYKTNYVHYKGRKEHYKKRFEEANESLSKAVQEKKDLTLKIKKHLSYARVNKTSVEERPKKIVPSKTQEDEGPIEVELSLDRTTFAAQKTVETITVLYAGKPGKENIFTDVSPQKDEHRSFYRLILENKDAQTASFEVLDTEYILRMAANSPDTYLFSVCKPENSNQNFDGKIITTQKGTARLLDGSWKVNDEDKAKIKFE